MVTVIVKSNNTEQVFTDEAWENLVAEGMAGKYRVKSQSKKIELKELPAFKARQVLIPEPESEQETETEPKTTHNKRRKPKH